MYNTDSFNQNGQDTHVLWLSCKLRSMSQDILHFSTFVSNDDVEDAGETRYKKYMKDAINFNAGAHICEKFLYGSINLDQFCAEMLEEDLKEFLIGVPHLPPDLVTKYNLDDVFSEDSVNLAGIGEVVTEFRYEMESEPENDVHDSAINDMVSEKDSTEAEIDEIEAIPPKNMKTL